MKTNKLIEKRLKEYGFKYENKYFFCKNIIEGKMRIEISLENLEKKELDIKVIDAQTEEEYILHKLSNTHGEFVNKIREEINKLVEDISDKCFMEEKTFNNQVDKIIEYLKEKYDNVPEFLWEKSPDTFVFRRKDNQKWYAIYMKISEKKLIKTSKNNGNFIGVLNIKMDSEKISEIIDNKRYFPAYHMNKKNWISIILNGNLELREIIQKINESYELVASKKRG